MPSSTRDRAPSGIRINYMTRVDDYKYTVNLVINTAEFTWYLYQSYQLSSLTLASQLALRRV